MVSEARKQSMAWMETDYSKHTHFRWKRKWRPEHLGALGIMGGRPHQATELITSPVVNKNKGVADFKALLYDFNIVSTHVTQGAGTLTVSLLVVNGYFSISCSF